MSGCDQQGLSDVMVKSDVLVIADIVRQAAQAIVASAQTLPSSSSTDLKQTQSTVGRTVESRLEQDVQKPDPIAKPILPPSPPVPSPPPESSIRLSTPDSSQSLKVPTLSQLPSSPAQLGALPQNAAPGASVINAPTSAQLTLPHVQREKSKARLGRIWHEQVWNEERKAVAERIGRVVVYGVAVWFAYVGVMILAYRFVDPPASNLMLYNYLKGNTVHHTWVPIEKISPAVIKAVVVAEDAQFCRHWGIDFAAIQYAIEHARGGTPRGASTITMQTAKNMFLWQSKSYVRKILEVPVTIMMELIWPKKRILEVYLNIAEWGPGVFGIGAAAKHHFKTKPAKLNTAAAARLAASLPNPKVRRAGRPGPKTRRKANVIRGRARHAGYYTGCVLR